MRKLLAHVALAFVASLAIPGSAGKAAAAEAPVLRLDLDISAVVIDEGDLDPELTSERVRDAVMAGFADAGLTFDAARGGPYVWVKLRHMYLKPIDFRQVYGDIAICDVGSIRGQQFDIVLCRFAVHSWRHSMPKDGPEAMLEELRRYSRTFGRACPNEVPKMETPLPAVPAPDGQWAPPGTRA